MNIENIIEAILFVSGSGVDMSIFTSAFDFKQKEIDNAIDNLKEKYSDESGIHLITYKNKLQFCSNPNYADKISEILNPIKEKLNITPSMESFYTDYDESDDFELVMEAVLDGGCSNEDEDCSEDDDESIDEGLDPDLDEDEDIKTDEFIDSLIDEEELDDDL